jgi:hypothetical protein
MSRTVSRTVIIGRLLPQILLAVFALLAVPAGPSAAEKKPILAVKVDGKDGPGFLAGLAQFETWFGQPASAVLGYTGVANWKDFEGSVGWSTAFWAKVDRPVLWSVPLIPARTTGNEKATLADAGKGLYNAHYKAVAQKLAQFRPKDSVIYVRTGWEFNGGWFAWTVHGGKGDDFIAAFRQFVTTFRSVSPRFRFDWCPAWGDQVWSDRKPVPLAQFYPGDEYVDVIGLDIYDEKQYTKIEDPVKRWQFYLKRGHGLNWHRRFATEHHKPMSFPEWGIGGAGDDPYFIEKFHQWVADNDVLYHTYWNSNAGYKGKLSTDKYPQAGARFKELFGEDPRRQRR